MSVEINGIAHVQLTVNDADRCVPFWEGLCHFLGMKTLIRGDGIVYCIGGRTGVLVRGVPEGSPRDPFDQNRVGLHHLCFRARSSEDVDEIHRYLLEQCDAKIVHAPEEGSEFAPGYYSVLFEDPDGIRVEVNYLPGKGHFGERGRLGPDGPGPGDGLGALGFSGSREGA
ncbi:MAG: VOC family protein [Myxococcales bacterium]|nr:VOC family protein [Myxococcales bacterium]